VWVPESMIRPLIGFPVSVGSASVGSVVGRRPDEGSVS